MILIIDFGSQTTHLIGRRIKEIGFPVAIVTAVESFNNGRAVCAISGGMDSTVAAFITYKAIGKNLTCFYVDTGLMRLGETEEVISRYEKNFQFNFRVINAEKIFLQNLKGITDP